MGQKREAEKDDTFYTVIRTVPLCAAKRYLCSPVAILPPGVEVQLLERSGKWIEIEAVLNAGTVDEGWVLKKYFRIRRQ